MYQWFCRIVCGFFQPLGSMPKPIFRYPLSYMAFHTYAFNGEPLAMASYTCSTPKTYP